MKETLFQRSTVFKKLLLNCILLILLPIFIFILFYSSTINRAFQKEILEMSEKNMVMMQQDVATFFRTAINTGITISIDPNIEKVLHMQADGEIYSYDYVKAVQDAGKTISMKMWGEENLHSAYLYNPLTSQILTLEGQIYLAEDFYDAKWLAESEVVKFVKICPVRQMTNEGMNIAVRESDDWVTAEVITILIPAAIKDGQPTGILVVNLFTTALPKMVYDNNVLIFNEDLQLINHRETLAERTNIIHQPDVKDFIANSETQGYEYMAYDGKQYLVNYAKIERDDLLMISMKGVSELRQQLNQYLYIILVLSVICIIFGLTYALKTIKTIYNPVNETLSLLNITYKDVSQKNELRVIYDTVNETIQQNNMIQTMLAEQQHNIKHAILTKVIRGNHDVDIEALNITGGICCLLISIDRFSDFANRHAIKDQFSLKMLIIQLAQEQINYDYSGFGMNLEGGQMLFLIDLGANPAHKWHDILDLLARVIKSEAKQIQDISLTCTFGRCYRDSNKIRSSYLESVGALKNRITYGCDSIIFYDDIDEDVPKPQVEKMMLNKMSNYIKKGDSDAAKSIFDPYIEQLKTSRYLTADNVLECFNPFISSINQYIEHDAKNKDKALLDQPLYKKVLEQETLMDIQRIFYQVLERLVAEKEKEMEQEHIIQKILRHIGRNYDDSSLDLTALADNYGVSYSHLRKLIKEEVGHSFVQYLNRLRINHAKQLLLQTTRGVKDIGLEVGYNTEQSFLRNFKKYEGITPSEFRKYGD